jgi:2',3'-cyclic-nucleotide 2'-phosphodiesterase (5'-nucleotidase family)
MDLRLKYRFLILLFFFSASVISQETDVVFLQINDVYEIAPLDNGKIGGMARIASIRNELYKQYGKIFTILSGDFISPSALGTSQYEGKTINGRQMVDVLNHIGLDYVTFGNHEFDYKASVLQERIDESNFTWITSNVLNISEGANIPFLHAGNPLPEYVILTVPGYIKGQAIRLGMVGLCIDANKQSYVYYEDYISAAKRVYSQIKDSIDYLVGITHLSIDDDKKLASEVPEFSLIMGGHEHENMYYKVGNTVIAKADANAKSVYIHRLIFDMHNKLIEIKSELKKTDSTVTEDPDVKQVVETWQSRAYDGFKAKGFDPDKVVSDFNYPVDGREEVVRNGLCPLGVMIAASMIKVSPGVNGAIFNSGMIRVDDILSGLITQYDIIRTMPFGGMILRVELKGSLLRQVLETGWKNKGSGGFLQFYGIENTADGWNIGNEKIGEDKSYNIAVNDFLISGKEQNLSFFNKDNPGILNIKYPDPDNKTDITGDIRFALIEYLKSWQH